MTIAKEQIACKTCKRIIVRQLEPYDVAWYYRWFDSKNGVWCWFCDKTCKVNYLHTLLESGDK